ncbi:MAG: Hsp20/alpha crystallin family protein [Gemmatirosa sp.]
MSSNKLQRHTFASPLMSSIARDMDQLQASVRRMFERPAAPGMASFAFPEPIGWLPAVEVSETDGELTMTAELPGLDRGDVHVDLDGDVLTLRGEKSEERTEQGKERQYHLVERSYGAFQRSFVLPASVDRDKITATFDKGVLTLRLPKGAESATRGRRIEIAGK